MTTGVPTFGGYLVERELGRGGMGIVYRATQQATGRPVALKLLLAARDPLLRARWQREAAALARLRHPGIVELIHAGEHDGTPFLALELVDGGSLRDRLRAGPLPPAQAAALVADVARAVHAAHEAGVIHRDLKPANVLLTPDGRPRVVDFGIARLFEATDKLTQTGSILGSSHYLSPEQLESAHDVDARADVYGLGAVLYEALTGFPPFADQQPPALWSKILKGPAPAPRDRVETIPAALDATCRKAMATDPAARHASALDLALELERTAGPPARRPRRARTRSWRSLVVPVVGVVVGVTVVAVVASTRAPTPTPTPSIGATQTTTVTTAPQPGPVPPAIEPAPEAATPDPPLLDVQALGLAGRWDDAVVECMRTVTDEPGRCGDPAFLEGAIHAGREAFATDATRSFFDDSPASPRADAAVHYFKKLLRTADGVDGCPLEALARGLVHLARALHARAGQGDAAAVEDMIEGAVDRHASSTTHLARGEWLASRGRFDAARADLVAASRFERPDVERRRGARLLAWVIANLAAEAGDLQAATRALTPLILGATGDLPTDEARDPALLERARARQREWSGQ